MAGSVTLIIDAQFQDNSPESHRPEQGYRAFRFNSPSRNRNPELAMKVTLPALLIIAACMLSAGVFSNASDIQFPRTASGHVAAGTFTAESFAQAPRSAPDAPRVALHSPSRILALRKVEFDARDGHTGTPVALDSIRVQVQSRFLDTLLIGTGELSVDIVTGVDAVAQAEAFHISGNFANPFTAATQFVVYTASTTNATIRLFSTGGKLVLSTAVELHSGSSRFNLFGPNLAAGLYLLEVSDNRGQRALTKLVKAGSAGPGALRIEYAGTATGWDASLGKRAELLDLRVTGYANRYEAQTLHVMLASDTTVTFVLDRSPEAPAITAFSASPTSVYAGDTVHFTVACTDWDGDLKMVSVDIEDDGSFEESYPVSGDGFDLTVGIPIPSTGSYKSRVRVEDEKGHQTEAVLASAVIVQRKAVYTYPFFMSFSVDRNSASLGDTVTYSVVVRDRDADLEQLMVDYEGDGIWDDSLDIAGNEFRHQFVHTYSVEGTYSPRARVIDQQGRTADTVLTNAITVTDPGRVPELRTSPVTDITVTTAKSGGSIVSDGGSPITARGVCWSAAPNPTIAEGKTSDGVGTGDYASNLTGLTENTTYYVRAYATNSNGTGYGNERSFTSADPGDFMPVLTTDTVTAITMTTASSGGHISSDGGYPVTERGVCWSMSPNPTTSDSKSSDGTGTGSFVSTITGLTENSTYYVRAYATNSNGTGYGNELSFTSADPNDYVPILTTSSVTEITPTTAKSGGNISSDGGYPITERGVCWSSSPGPTVTNDRTSDGTGTGSFISIIAGLTENTTYYIRAYAINSVGTGYGNELEFTSGNPHDYVPVLTTSPVTEIMPTSAKSGGGISSDGGYPITERGVCWSSSPGPTVTNDRTSDGTGTGSFISTITGLTENSTYYLRAYATNSNGTGYGNELSFTTADPSAYLPLLSTTSVTDITPSTAKSGGTISSNGGYPVMARGVCWSTVPGPTTAGSKTNDGTGTGTFVSSITGLAANTTYYVRAYAVNNIGAGYGTEVSFATQQGSIGDSVTIGTQVWMLKNLDVDKYRNGDPIPHVTDPTQWASLTTGAWCYCDNDSAMGAIYGKLYNWYAVSDPRGLAPAGWHVPTDDEWKALEMYLGMTQSQADATGLYWRGTNEGGKLKEAGTAHWQSPNTGADNSSGFTALPGGSRSSIDGSFYTVGYLGCWWLRGECSGGVTVGACTRTLYSTNAGVARDPLNSKCGVSVRCVRD
jgi:uncharacterized protein (TIGR02145 family)